LLLRSFEGITAQERVVDVGFAVVERASAKRRVRFKARV
jgi:hypothetical protein